MTLTNKKRPPQRKNEKRKKQLQLLLPRKKKRDVVNNKNNRLARVQPGVITAVFQDRVKHHGLFYPPDPASMAFSSIGGNIAENAGGMRAVKYGVTKDFVMGLEVVLADGEVIRVGGRNVKDVMGYDLTRLLVGSEGTLGIITEATLKLRPKPAPKASEGVRPPITIPPT